MDITFTIHIRSTHCLFCLQIQKGQYQLSVNSVSIFKTCERLFLLQTSHPVLLLQPDRTLRTDLLYGFAWIHASTGFGGETYAWWVDLSVREVWPTSGPTEYICGTRKRDLTELEKKTHYFGMLRPLLLRCQWTNFEIQLFIAKETLDTSSRQTSEFFSTLLFKLTPIQAEQVIPGTKIFST